MGGLGASEIILVLIAFGIIIIFPVWGYRAGSKRAIGPIGGLLLGLFLNWIGIIIVYCTNRIDEQKSYNFPDQSSADELKKYKQLLDNGAITEAEYRIQKARILNSNGY